MSNEQKEHYRVLAVDDDTFNLRIVTHAFEHEGFEVMSARSGEEALKVIAERGMPHIAIIDLHMPPGMSGFELCRSLHQFSDLPVVMLTAVNEEQTVVAGLEEHAEDYIIKPFNPGELVARVRRVLRRAGESSYPLTAVMQIDERLAVDFPSRQVFVHGKPVSLTPTETKLLYVLMRAAGEIVNTDFILRRLWPHEPAFEDRLHVHMHRLRRKIEDKEDKSRPRYIVSERGQGYSFRKLSPPS